MEGFIKHTYFNTYYYANIVNNVVIGDFEFIGFISSFFDPEGSIYQLSKPFQKRTAFHLFIQHIVAEYFDNDMHEHDERDFKYVTFHSHGKFTPYAERVLDYYGINHGSYTEEFKSYQDVEEYHTALYESGILWDLYEVIADEIFYIMFNNRDVLLRFNYMMALHMDNVNFEDFKAEEYQEFARFFSRNCRLKRVKIPEWCKKAVYFRDRGRCCLCHQDLSATLSLNNKKHYDHIIPLAQGGLNDVANIQLLCSTCNENKNHRQIVTSELYERWF